VPIVVELVSSDSVVPRSEAVEPCVELSPVDQAALGHLLEQLFGGELVRLLYMSLQVHAHRENNPRVDHGVGARLGIWGEMPRTLYPSSPRARTLDRYGRPGLLCGVGGTKTNEMNWRWDAADVNEVKVHPGDSTGSEVSLAPTLFTTELNHSPRILSHPMASSDQLKAEVRTPSPAAVSPRPDRKWNVRTGSRPSLSLSCRPDHLASPSHQLDTRSQGNAAFSVGDFQVAFEKFKEAIDVDPSNHVLYVPRQPSHSVSRYFLPASCRFSFSRTRLRSRLR